MTVYEVKRCKKLKRRMEDEEFDLELTHRGGKFNDFRPIKIRVKAKSEFMKGINKGDFLHINIDIKKISEDEAMRTVVNNYKLKELKS